MRRLLCILASFGGGECYQCLHAHPSVFLCLLHTTCKQTHISMRTYTHKQKLKSWSSPTPYTSLLGWGNESKTLSEDGWEKWRHVWFPQQPMVLLHSTLCPLIGLCNSLHLEAHVIPSNLLPKHKRANPETRLRGWGGMTQLRHGKSEGCCSGGEKGASEADGGVRRSQCVIINKALKKSEHIKAYRGYAIIHESNALWLNVS